MKDIRSIRPRLQDKREEQRILIFAILIFVFFFFIYFWKNFWILKMTGINTYAMAHHT